MKGVDEKQVMKTGEASRRRTRQNVLLAKS